MDTNEVEEFPPPKKGDDDNAKTLSEAADASKFAKNTFSEWENN